MRRASLAFTVACLALGVAAVGCPADPVCGNGVVEDGEDASTCCSDAGCGVGACVDNACHETWQELCAAADGASGCNAPFLCSADGAAPPVYDCATCGCTSGDACVDDGDGGVCVDVDTRNLARDAPAVPNDLDPPEYAEIYTQLGAMQPRAVSDIAATVAADAVLDRRFNAVVFGAFPGSDVDGVAAAFLAPFLEYAALSAELERPARADACAAVAVAAAAGFAPDVFVSAVVDVDVASRATCPFEGAFSHCVSPHVDDCVLRAGRLSQPVIVLDQRVSLVELDQALLLRAGLAPPELTLTFLDEGIAVFTVARGIVGQQPGLLVGSRFAAAWQLGGAVWIVILEPDARPHRLGSFRALWTDAPSQAFLVDHGIVPGDCSFAFDDAGNIEISCGNDGFVISAVVDAGSFSLIDVVTTEP